MQPFLAIVLAGAVSRLGYQMARSPVLPRFAQDLGAAPELLGLIVAASTITGIFVKLPAGALSDVLGKRRMMLIGCIFFAADASYIGRDDSEAWMNIYPDADWAAAKEPLMQCVKQGLYSKCFAVGFPCRPKPE